MPKRFCLDCGRLFDRDATGTQRCPQCQPAATARRQARGSTAARGYGAAHQRLRRQLLGAFEPGQPCARCGKPIASADDAQLGHLDGDRGRYRGLEHVRCNEATSGRRLRCVIPGGRP
jgi:DNA-directed RNA polymerase subunit RPC12/RpoP